MNDDLRTKLWNYVYGLLDEAEADSLRRQITSDRDVARMYARVKLQSELVGQAARASTQPGEWSILPDGAPARPAQQAPIAARVAINALSMALSFLLLVYAGSVYWPDNSPIRSVATAQVWDSFEKTYPRLMVTGPAVLQRGESTQYQVLLKTLDDEPLQMAVEASLAEANGQTVWREKAATDASGTLWVNLPENLNGTAYRLKIAADNVPPPVDFDIDADRAEMETWLAVSDPGPTQLVAQEQIHMANTNYALFSRTVLADVTDNSEPKPVADAKAMKSGVRQKKAGAPLAEESGAEQDLALANRRAVTWGIRGIIPAGKPAENSLAALHGAERGQEYFQSSKLPPKDGEARLERGGVDDAPSPAPESPAQNVPLPLPGEIDVLQKSASQATPEAVPSLAETSDELALNKAKAGRDGKVLVETTWANGRPINSRFVGGVSPDRAMLTVEDDRARADSLASSFFGEVAVTLEDYTVAPPQRVAQETQRFDPLIQPLHVAIRFDRFTYHADEPATAEITVTDEHGSLVAAVLSVRVDAVPLEQADRDPEIQDEIELSYSTSTTIGQNFDAFPLVFDNAGRQSQHLQQSVEQWLDVRASWRRSAAWILLIGSGLGYALLLTGALLRALPRTRNWLLAALLFGFTGVMALTWMYGSDETAPSVSVTPLTNYGMSAEPPVPGPSGQQDDYLNWAFNGQADGLRIAGTLTATPGSDESFSRLPELQEGVKSWEDKWDRQTLPPTAHWYELARTIVDREVEDQFSLRFRDDFGRWSAVDQRPGNAGGDALAQGAYRYVPPSAVGPTSSSGGEAINGPLSRPESLPISSGDTVYWHPAVTTDARGMAKVDFDIPSKPVAHRLVVRAHANGRYGSASNVVPTSVHYRHP